MCNSRIMALCAKRYRLLSLYNIVLHLSRRIMRYAQNAGIKPYFVGFSIIRCTLPIFAFHNGF